MLLSKLPPEPGVPRQLAELNGYYLRKDGIDVLNHCLSLRTH